METKYSGRVSYCLRKRSGTLSYVFLLLLRTFWKELQLYRVLQILTSGFCSSHLSCLYVVGLVAPRVPQLPGSPGWAHPGRGQAPGAVHGAERPRAACAPPRPLAALPATGVCGLVSRLAASSPAQPFLQPHRRGMCTLSVQAARKTGYSRVQQMCPPEAMKLQMRWGWDEGCYHTVTPGIIDLWECKYWI